MKKFTSIIVIIFSLIPMLKAQTLMESTLEIKYNQTSCLYEAHLHVGGAVASGLDDLLATAGFCIVVPASVPNTSISCTSLTPGTWTDQSPAYNVLTFDGYKDYHKFATYGGQFYPPLVAGADIILFTFSLPTSVCPSGIRMFENNYPAPSPTPDTNPPGMTYDNSIQTLLGETYTDNTGNPVTLPVPGLSSSYSFSCNASNLYLTANGSTVLGCNTLTYNWSGPGNYTSTQKNPVVNPYTAPGTYTVTVTDANRCTASSMVVLAQPPQALNTTATAVNATCGNANGSVNLTVSGGTIPYNYTWSNGASTEDLTNVAAGNYFVTVADINGCTITYNIAVLNATDPPPVPIITQNGNTLFSSAPTGNQWYNDSGIITGANAPSYSPTVTGNYYVVVTNTNGCISGNSNVIYFVVGSGYTISGKTRYAAKAMAGNPPPNLPAYSSVKYNINKVVVILKSYPAGTELARDTSNAFGVYQFTNVANGTYILSYDKYVADTMQYCDQVNSIDLALLKYFVGHDTVVDPSRSFTIKHKNAANVDNSYNAYGPTVNMVDIGRISAKIAAPYDRDKNFPKGNWVAIDTSVTVAGSDLNVTLQTICYGDYDASSTKYKDSATYWSMAKSLPDENIILRSDESINSNNNGYFEVPLRISTSMIGFSSLGLELGYPSDKYKLEKAFMPKTSNNIIPVKINPTLYEIIAQGNDLLVTDNNGIIRVVFATINNFDVAANDELIRLGFRSIIEPDPGKLDFYLTGTGLIADQYGQNNDGAYLLMPTIFFQGNGNDVGFEFAGYPNPFNGQATLTYKLPEDGTVKLRVYNAKGWVIEELVDQWQISGEHSVVFSPENLPSGMYTFKLEYTGQHRTKRMILKLIH